LLHYVPHTIFEDSTVSHLSPVTVTNKEVMKSRPDHTENILSGRQENKEQLKDIFRQVLRNKIEKFEKGVGEFRGKSSIELLLERSQEPKRKFDSLPTDTFLDRLTHLYVNGANVPLENNEIEVIVKNDKSENSDPSNDISTESTFLDKLTKVMEQEDSYYKELINYDNVDNFDVEDLFPEQEILQENYEREGARPVISLFPDDYKNIDNTEFKQFDDTMDENLFKKSFVEEEISSTESEMEEIANQLALLLVDIEADHNAEIDLIQKAKDTIKSRLEESHGLGAGVRNLAQDPQFIDSVLYRFALMNLPLRREDISVSEQHQVRAVVRTSLGLLAQETQALLLGDSHTTTKLGEARNKLQKLLNIMEG